MPSWLPRLLIHCAFFVAAYLIAVRLFNVGYFLLIKAGATLPSGIFNSHDLARAALVGLLAGMLPVELILSGFGWFRSPNSEVPAGALGFRPQRWTWIPFTCWLLYGIVKWASEQGAQSVLATSRPITPTSILNTFFLSPCRSGWLLSLTNVEPCSRQLIYTTLWVGSVTYSGAAFLLAFTKSNRKHTLHEDTI